MDFDINYSRFNTEVNILHKDFLDMSKLSNKIISSNKPEVKTFIDFNVAAHRYLASKNSNKGLALCAESIKLLESCNEKVPVVTLILLDVYITDSLTTFKLLEIANKKIASLEGEYAKALRVNKVAFREEFWLTKDKK